MPADKQVEQVDTSGTVPFSQQQVAEVAGSSNDPIVFQTYTRTVATRNYRFEEDGWDFTKAQTATSVNIRG